ncbi:PEP/pyruvate-binding domain-containing protein [Aquihabitans daechungensis]|uniref:PEP/pyruvate-binding domain-containing protein n=1 Tax=Aquihabitans daechungensis TaxID=1052257 RepID=UPI003B9F5818
MTLDCPPSIDSAEHPVVIGLDHPDALDPARVGGKAAALARAWRAGFRTMPAAVLSTSLSVRYDHGLRLDAPEATRLLATAMDQLGGASQTLVVRSSSVVEDQADSSKAGQFESVLDVRGPDELRVAVETVLQSRAAADAAEAPIAVLIQPMVHPSVAGVAFGVDPVSGRSDRRVVTAVAGTPDRLVSGEVDGSRWLLTPDGSVVDSTIDEGVALSRRDLREVVALGEALAASFDGPQDVEWARVDGQLVVLQSRPITTEVRGVPSGPVYGPGPVAETFPEALSPLEHDLWVPPLREGVREALRISGAVPSRELDERPLVISVEGQIALDLEITGEIEGRTTFGHRLAARMRHLRSAWRIGRLRVALPVLAHDLCARADRDLEQLPPFDELATRQLVALIGRGQEALRSLHAHEILMGLVSNPSGSAFTGASVALRILTEARRDGLPDDEIVRRAPVVLSLVPPRVGPSIELPEASSAVDLRREAPEAAVVQVNREALRLRARWMQELLGQAAYEVGRRLVERGELDHPDQIRHLHLDDLAATASWQAAVDHGAIDAIRSAEAQGPARRPSALPAQFQLSDTGRAIPVIEPGESGGGTGAGGGTARGPVTHDVSDPAEGSILVVGALTPQLGPKLPRLAGIVSETGSVLSHLAILARESGVATVVGHHGALDELPEGTVVTVDGGSGRVTKEVTP